MTEVTIKIEFSMNSHHAKKEVTLDWTESIPAVVADWILIQKEAAETVSTAI